MAVQAVEVASVGEVPDNCYWGAGGLGISQSEISDSFDNVEHAPADKLVFQQLFYRAIINVKTEE